MKPDFRIFKEETTKFWREDIRQRAGQLFGVYIFDANKHVHCAELTPSFEMHFLGPTWSGHIEDEDKNAKLFDDILSGNNDTDPVKYVHVRSVNVDDCEKIGVSDGSWERFLKYNDGDEEAAWKEVLEIRSDHCRGNGYIY